METARAFSFIYSERLSPKRFDFRRNIADAQIFIRGAAIIYRRYGNKKKRSTAKRARSLCAAEHYASILTDRARVFSRRFYPRGFFTGCHLK